MWMLLANECVTQAARSPSRSTAGPRPTTNNKAFLGITGHCIDDGWAMQSLVLDFVPLQGEHTGEKLCGAFVGACERPGILDKLLGVTTDNASNIGKLLECLERACPDRAASRSTRSSSAFDASLTS